MPSDRLSRPYCATTVGLCHHGRTQSRDPQVFDLSLCPNSCSNPLRRPAVVQRKSCARKFTSFYLPNISYRLPSTETNFSLKWTAQSRFENSFFSKDRLHTIFAENT